MKILTPSARPIKRPTPAQVALASIVEFYRRYRWSQRQVAERPSNRFEHGVLAFNKWAVRLLIADYRRGEYPHRPFITESAGAA